MAKQSPIQKLEALSSKRKQSALSLESQLNEANEALAAAVTSQNTSTETELSASQNLKKATKKDKEIKKNLAYRFPVVREKYAKLITDAKTQDAMAKSDAASAKTALVSISKKIDILKKKKEEAVKLSEETTKQFSDAIRLQEKTIDDLSKLSDTDDTGSYNSALKEMAVKTEIQKRSKKDPEFSVARKRAQAAVATAKQEIGMVQKRKTSSLFKSVGRTRDKAIDPYVERHVLGDISEEGKKGQKGTRVRAEEFAQANPQLFNENELEGSAARELLEEAVQLSELALKATTSNADKIMGRISYLEKVATDAGDDEVAKIILDIIKPLKKSVASKTTFRAMLKKRFTDYVGSLPEMFARKIPLIGGLIGDFMQQKREAKEDTKEYRESQLEGISKKGQIGSGLKFEKRGGSRSETQYSNQSTNNIMRGIGASPASESGILNGLGGASGIGGISSAPSVDGLGGALSPSSSELTATTKTPIYEVLKSTYDKIVSIEELLHEAIDPEESALRDAESASEADVGLLSKKDSKGGETKKEKSWLGSLISMLTDKLMPWIKGLFGPIGATIMGLAKSAIGSITSVASKAVELGKSVGGKAFGAAKSIGGKAVDVVKNVGGKAYGAAKSIGGKALELGKSVGGKALEFGKSVGGKAFGAAKSIGGTVLGKVSDVAGSLGKDALKGFVKAVGGVGKFAKVLLKAPVIGTAISAAIAGFNIADIKQNAKLSSKEKKKEIGNTIGSGLGGIIGSVGGSALGSIFPGPGTILGAIGGGVLGDYLGGIIADQVGGEEIYNIVRSIPLVGDLINVDDDVEKKKDMAGAATGLPAAAGIKEVQKNNYPGGDDLLSPSSPAEKKEGLKRIGTSIQAELDSRKKSGTSVAPNMSKSGYRIEQNGKVMSEANSEREIGMNSNVIDMNIEMGESNIKRITDNDLQRRLKEIKEETASTGTIARSSTPNTTVGQQVQKYNGEKSALEEETEKKASQVGGGSGGTSVVNAPTNTVVNNNTNIQQNGGTRPNERTAMLMNRETATH
jgi:hypothetical protein